MPVIIGVDPHKQSHTAVAICGEEREVAKVTVRATRQQADKLLAWAEPFKERTWVIESAGGLGYLLAQQLVDVGEHVVDVPPTLAARGAYFDRKVAEGKPKREVVRSLKRQISNAPYRHLVIDSERGPGGH